MLLNYFIVRRIHVTPQRHQSFINCTLALKLVSLVYTRNRSDRNEYPRLGLMLYRPKQTQVSFRNLYDFPKSLENVLTCEVCVYKDTHMRCVCTKTTVPTQPRFVGQLVVNLAHRFDTYIHTKYPE